MKILFVFENLSGLFLKSGVETNFKEGVPVYEEEFFDYCVVC